MPDRMILIVLMLIGMAIGVFHTYSLLAASRKAYHRSDTLLDWTEEPLPAWKFEPYAMISSMIHTGAVLALSIAAINASVNPGILNDPLYHNETNMIVLSWIIRGGSIAIIGYQFGALLTMLLMITFRKTPVSIAVTEQGLLDGRTMIPWKWFSQYTAANEGGLLLFYSAFAPDFPTVILKPPASVNLVEFDKLLQVYLPQKNLNKNNSWYRTRLWLNPAIAVICMLAVIAGWLAAALPAELSLFVIAVLTTGLGFICGRIVSLFAFGVHQSGAFRQTQL